MKAFCTVGRYILLVAIVLATGATSFFAAVWILPALNAGKGLDADSYWLFLVLWSGLFGVLMVQLLRLIGFRPVSRDGRVLFIRKEHEKNRRDSNEL